MYRLTELRKVFVGYFLQELEIRMYVSVFMSGFETICPLLVKQSVMFFLCMFDLCEICLLFFINDLIMVFFPPLYMLSSFSLVKGPCIYSHPETITQKSLNDCML
jgi:hypothetical protein